MKTIAEGLDEFQKVSERLLVDLRSYLKPYGAVLGGSRFGEGLAELVAGMLGAVGAPMKMANDHRYK